MLNHCRQQINELEFHMKKVNKNNDLNEKAFNYGTLFMLVHYVFEAFLNYGQFGFQSIVNCKLFIATT